MAAGTLGPHRKAGESRSGSVSSVLGALQAGPPQGKPSSEGAALEAELPILGEVMQLPGWYVNGKGTGGGHGRRAALLNTFLFLKCWRARKPLHAAWKSAMFLLVCSSRCSSSLARVPARKNACRGGEQVSRAPGGRQGAPPRTLQKTQCPHPHRHPASATLRASLAHSCTEGPVCGWGAGARPHPALLVRGDPCSWQHQAKPPR